MSQHKICFKYDLGTTLFFLFLLGESIKNEGLEFFQFCIFFPRLIFLCFYNQKQALEPTWFDWWMGLLIRSVPLDEAQLIKKPYLWVPCPSNYKGTFSKGIFVHTLDIWVFWKTDERTCFWNIRFLRIFYFLISAI